MINLKKKYTDCLNFVVNKVVILRLDLNLPSYDGLFTDLTRLEKVIPTIEDLLKNNAKLVIISHLGRPRGKVSEKYSLKPIVAKLEQKIKIPVAFSENDILKTKPEKILKKLEDEKILMLENIRFYPEEEKNDDEFSKRLSKFGDIFINECFSVSHRNHSSIVGIPKFLPSFPGKLLEFEVNFIKSIISNKDIKNNVGPDNFKINMGYAGWDKGQLEDEIKNGDWLLKPFSKKIIFDISDQDMWEFSTLDLGLDANDYMGKSGRA